MTITEACARVNPEPEANASTPVSVSTDSSGRVGTVFGRPEPRDVTTTSWQRSLAEAFRDPHELLNDRGIDATAAGLRMSRSPAFPMLVPRSFARRMEFGDPHDPLLRQVLPLDDEQQPAPGFVGDPVDDASARRGPGILQKYHGRVLLIASGSCAVHCRYCFRREYPYSDEPRRPDEWDEAVREIEDDDSISEVILSGGDPLMLSDDRLAGLMNRCDAIPHIRRIRLHTRLPIVLPDRVTDRLLTTLTSLRSAACVVVHANHAHEIRGDCIDALRMLVRSGITTLNQAVLLRSINDTFDDQLDLCESLINIGVIPYYLHRLDRVAGAAHFESETRIGREIIQRLRARLPGYAVPRFVAEVAGKSSKVVLDPSGG